MKLTDCILAEIKKLHCLNKDDSQFDAILQKIIEFLSHLYPELHSRCLDELFEHPDVSAQIVNETLSQLGLQLNHPKIKFDATFTEFSAGLTTKDHIYLTVPLPTEIPIVDKKGNVTGTKTQLQPFVITSYRGVFEFNAAELSERGFVCRQSYDFQNTRLSNRWALQDIQAFLEGKEQQLPIHIVFEKIQALFQQYLYFSDPVVHDCLALYVFSSYAYQFFQNCPILFFHGPKQSGKTRALSLFKSLAFEAVAMIAPTTASLLRASACSTILLDEIECLYTKKTFASGISSILKSGYKSGMLVPRCEENKMGGGYTLRWFDVYCPKVIANISGLEEVLADRAITITFKRKGDNTTIEQREPAEHDPIWSETRNQLYLILMLNFQEIRSITLDEPALSNRELELWTPILTMAKFVDRSGKTNLYDAMRDFAVEKAKENQITNAEQDQTYKMLQVLSELVTEDRWYSTHEVSDEFQKFCTDDSDWLNDVWLGRMMTRLGIGLTKETRRRMPAMTAFEGEKKLTHYYITRNHILDYATRYSVAPIDRVVNDAVSGRSSPVLLV